MRQSPKIKVGDSVRVKAGITDPDDPSIDWNGWQGCVVSIQPTRNDPTLITLELDSVTLRSFSPEYIETSEEEGLDWTRLYLYPSDTEPAQPRDTPEERKKARDELKAQYSWTYLGAQGRRIQAVLGESAAKNDWKQMQVWAAYLEEHLSFPFEVEVDEYQERGPLRSGDRLRALSIEDDDDSYGVIIKARRGRHTIYTPLADLKIVPEASANDQIVDDYRVWFANR